VTSLGFDSLASKSRSFHGHKYVLPVAAWILSDSGGVIGVSDAIVGLGGRADRPRVIEALEKLAGIGALVELPRVNQPNAARMFQRVDSPYWALVAAETGIPGNLPSKPGEAGHLVG
jgi:hypothetical protein